MGSLLFFRVLSRQGSTALLISILLLFPAQTRAAEGGGDWPQYRGPNMDATIAGARAFEAGKTYSLEVNWQKTLGSGYSGIAIVQDHVVTMFSDGTWDHVVALDAATGSEIWRVRLDSTFVGRFGSQDGPLSTPLIAENKVFALGPKGQLLALDLMSGKQMWQTNIVREHGTEAPFYGITTSPVVHDGLLLLETGGSQNNTVTAFDKKTGEKVWTAGTDKVSYQSPVLLRVDGKVQLLCVGDNFLYGLTPESGAMQWEFAHEGSGGMGAGCLNPVVLPDNKLFLTYKDDESILVQLKKGSGPPDLLWKSNVIKGTYVVPVYWDGYLYGYSSTFLTCVDAASGRMMWKSRQPGDGLPIVVDGHLVIVTKKGAVSIAKASPEGYTEMANLQLFGDLAWTPPSFANGRIYARSLGEIASIDIVPQGQQMRAAASSSGIISDSRFGRFIEKVGQSADKQGLIDDFLAAQKTFPIIENNNLVHFVYRGEASEMALAGEIFGYESNEPMHRVEGTDLFYYSLQMEPSAHFGYQFLKDLQDHINDPLNPDKTSVYFLGEMSLLSMPDWQPADHLQVRGGTVTGQLDSLVFHSTVTDSTRTLEVYLPAGYADSQARYPVAYVHATTRQFGITTSLDNLMGTSVEPAIVVFVPPLVRGGYRGYIGTLRDQYARAFVEEVVPLIDRNYRTKPAPEFRANIGTFYGGLMAFYTAFKHPGTFGRLGTQSIYWDPDEDQKHRSLLANAKAENIKIYHDWSKYDFRSPLEGWDFGAYARLFAGALRETGHQFEGGETYDGFSWENWRNRADRLLESVLPLQ